MPSAAPVPGEADPLNLRGVIPPTITAFDANEAVDHEATAAHARFVVEGGARAVFPLGTNGEFPLLAGEERRAVVETVIDAVEVPVIPGVGSPSTHTTVEHARHAAAAGAAGIVVVTPYYYPLDEEGAVRHYRGVVEAIDIPVYAYHIPSKTGNKLSLSTLDRLAAIDGLAGVKDSSKDVPWLAQAIDGHPELTFLVGSDSLLFTGLDLGCAGMVSAVANVFPELISDLYQAYDDGDRSEARRLQSKVFEVRSLLKRGPYMAGVKTALSMRDVGFDIGELRSPLRPMDEAQRDELASGLRGLGLL